MRWVAAHLGFFALVCFGCVVYTANAQQYCSSSGSGTQRLLTDLTGNITDHTGSGNYNNDMECTWVINPPASANVSSITLSFQKFDLEYGYDSLTIYTCACTDQNKEFVWFTGSTVPQDVIVPTSVVTIVFFSDDLVTGTGFSLSYYANNCTNGCSGKGTCHTNHCDCYPGFTGPDCSQTVCYNNCSYPAGECNTETNACVCDFGYYGGDCSSAYCNALSTVADFTGSFTDHRGYGEYLNNMECHWLIQPNPPRQSITLSFTYFDTEAGYDFVTIYDGTTTAGQQLGHYSGNSIPPRTTAVSGAMLVVWRTNEGVTRTGFDASFNATDCPGGCSDGQGDCIDGNCHCDLGFTGTDCSETTCTDDCLGRGTCDTIDTDEVCNCAGTNYTGGNCGSCMYDAYCEIEYCYPYFHLHNVSGVFSDKISGEGNYKPEQYCVWEIYPQYSDPNLEISGISINITQLDLELNQAYIKIYRGSSATAANLIGLFTGEELPPVINSDEPLVTVVFESSGTEKVRKGFEIVWNITYCATNCNGNGLCTLGNICDCYPGWEGNDCSNSVCVGTCNSPAGQCIDDRCVCEPGWYSPSCTATYCSGLTTLDGDSGLVKDHGDGETYRSNSDCDFRIVHQNASETYSLVWIQFELDSSLGDSVDYVNLFDGYSGVGSDYLLAGRSGSFLPHPVKSSNNSLYLQFKSGDLVNFPGFQAVYTANSRCPAGCSGTGYCYNGTCICDQGTEGVDCSKDVDATSISFDHRVNNSVSSFQWKYYSFKVPKHTSQLTIEAYQTSSQGNSEYFVKADDFPGLRNYDFAYGQGTGTQGVNLHNPPEGATIYLGIYENSLEYSNYTINLTIEKEDEPSYRGAAIALAVLVFVLFGIAGVCVFVLWKKTRKLNKQQREETGLPGQESHEMSSGAPQQGPGYARFEDE